ncbi:MAG: hypothetical protein Phyf2KO_11720 [Phycisphaerales bacterium]
MESADTLKREGDILSEQYSRVYKQTDRMFAWLMVLQFAAGLVMALVISPRTWQGDQSSTHIHVLAALTIGGLLAALPIYLVWKHSGTLLSRTVIGISQVLFSALFIHLSGGRIETHFHVFGSLAFLSLYRDWKVLILPTLVVAADHLARAIFWPQSVFGVISAAPWRAIEHAGWVLFEDVFLIYGCIRATQEMRSIAHNQARLESMKAVIEQEVESRTRELSDRTDALQSEIIERKMLQDQLLQAQKLESIGQLAAGIAHEINTPSQYVSDNTRFVREQFDELLAVIDRYAEQIDPDAPAMSWQDRVSDIKETLKKLDYDFLREEIPLALEQSLEGIDRIAKIVGAMKDFSHPGSTDFEMADINRAIRSTAVVCSNRWKQHADIEMDLDEQMPAVSCLLAEFNQVVLNLITNSADAIADRHGDAKGMITIRTAFTDDWAEITVQDNGGGIPASIRDKVFDPFFTTKEVGKGTGQGLSISRDIVVTKHGGEMLCESTEDEGTIFTIRLPRGSDSREVAAA